VVGGGGGEEGWRRVREFIKRGEVGRNRE